MDLKYQYLNNYNISRYNMYYLNQKKKKVYIGFKFGWSIVKVLYDQLSLFMIGKNLSELEFIENWY